MLKFYRFEVKFVNDLSVLEGFEELASGTVSTTLSGGAPVTCSTALSSHTTHLQLELHHN